MVDAVRRGPGAAPCIFFEVATLAQADSLIQRRCALKGTGTTIFEALTAEEQRQQAALWLPFLAAKRAGANAVQAGCAYRWGAAVVTSGNLTRFTLRPLPCLLPCDWPLGRFASEQS